MRIVIVSETFWPRTSSTSVTVRQVLDGLVRAGHEPVLVTPGPGTGDYRGVPVVRTRAVPTRTFPVGLPDPVVEQVLARVRPDVVHLASPWILGASALRAARASGLPVVAEHGTHLSALARHAGVPSTIAATLPLDRWWRRIHRDADLTLVPHAQGVRDATALGAHAVRTWRHGADLDLFGAGYRNPALHAHWTRRRGATDPVVVGYVGRLAAEKDVRRLEEVAHLPGVRLVVVGEGPESGRLHRTLPAHFTGHVAGHHLAETVASLDVLVQPGRWDMTGQGVRAAQASGVPVVAAAAGAPLDLVEDGVTGWLFDPDDPAALRRTLAEAAASPAERARRAHAAYARVAERPWSTAVEELVGIWAGVATRLPLAG
jgi:phosphatidylinositol alpha 1,6-mannosyltransferase